MSTVGASSVVEGPTGGWARTKRAPCAALALTAMLGSVLMAAQTPQESAGRPSVIEPKAQALLAKAIQALGGASFLAFKRLATSGRSFAFEEGESAGFAPFQSVVEYPDKRRFSYGKKEPVVLLNNGEKGWELDRYGRTTQKREQLRRWILANRYSLENLLRLRIHEPGLLIQDSGTDFVDQLPASVVTMVDARQIEVKLFLSKSTFLPIRIAYRLRTLEGDDWDEYADDYSDYKNIQNIQTPMHVTRLVDKQRDLETYRNTAKYDESYPPGYFEPPQRCIPFPCH